MSKRTDCHRPGAIIPRDYEAILSYSLPGQDEPGCCLTEARELWMPGGVLPRDSRVGSLGSCGVCGSRFRHGDIYVHVPTGHIITMGHDCAAKYDLVADRDDWNAQLEAIKRNRAARIEALLRDERLERFCAQNDGMASVLAITHPILFDMVEKVRRFGDLSEKQVEFALKLAREAWCPTRPTERRVSAPEGRMIVRGRIVSIKTQEGAFGDTLRMTVKVETDDGVWLAWGPNRVGLTRRRATRSNSRGPYPVGTRRTSRSSSDRRRPRSSPNYNR